MAKLSVDQTLLRAKSHAKKGEFDEAQKLYNSVLQAFPKNGRAQKGLDAVIKLNTPTTLQNPPQKLLYRLLGYYQNGQLSDAEKLAVFITQEFPKHQLAWKVLGAVLAATGRQSEAANAKQRAVALSPQDAEAHYNLGITLKELGRLDEAEASYKQAITLKPDHTESYYNLGILLKELGRLEEAEVSFRQAIALMPHFAQIHYNLGITLQELGRLDETEASFRQAIALKPDYTEAHYNLGIMFKELGRLEEAEASFRQAIALKPDYAEAHNNLGLMLQELGRLDEAEASYKQTIALKPDYAQFHYNLGNALRDQGSLSEAIASYEKALSLNPEYSLARVQKLHQQAHICDWSAMEKDERYFEHLGTKDEHATPFAMLAIEDAPYRHRQRSEKYTKEKYPYRSTYVPHRTTQKPGHLRIGYFSADFHDHATMYLIAQIFEEHDKSHFKVSAYSYGPDKQDEMRDRLVKSVDVFHDVRKMSDLQIVELARKEKLDIAIDLKGFTQNTRLTPFAYGMAPIQISYLGYPGTTGAEFIDYIVADPIVIPNDKRHFYSEQIIYLPNTYQPTDSTRLISEKLMTREGEGLPSDSFVFCCFNNNYKISAREFDIWMRLLTKAEGSVLWLLKSNKWSEHHLKKEAEARGVSADRLIFANRLPQAEHLARHQLADLFLDTFNYNAHTTASDALWAGLPVVTKTGEGFAARVASSLLSAIGLSELITMSEQQYEMLCLDLFEKPKRLSKIKNKLRANRLSQPLFDTQKYTKYLENGYQLAYQRYFDGEDTDVIFVPK